MGATAVIGDREGAFRTQLTALREEVLRIAARHHDIVELHRLLRSQLRKERKEVLDQLTRLKKTHAALDRTRLLGFELDSVDSPSPHRAVRCWVEQGRDSLIICAEGEIDLASAPELLRRLEQLNARRRNVVMDLSRVDYFDLHGVRLVERFKKVCDQRGQKLAIVAAGPVLRMLQMMRVEKTIPLHASRRDALRSP